MKLHSNFQRFRNRFTVLLTGILLCVMAQGQTEHQKNVFRAMADELQRSMDSLRIADWEQPFFIQYALQEGRLFQVQAMLGAVVAAYEYPVGCVQAQVLAGNYQLANINLQNSDSRAGTRSDSAPIDGDYGEIRRRLWLLSDNAYKQAIEEYSNKAISMKQLNLPPEVLMLPDFLQLPSTEFYGTAPELPIHSSRWEQLARDCSAVFKKFPTIYSSNAGFEVYSGEIFSVNSEGTRLLHPIRMVAMSVTAYTKTDDGEVISDRLVFYGMSEDDFNDQVMQTVMQQIEVMAENIVALARAPRLEESYTGPVLLEDGALAQELVSELLSPRTGLVAYRTPLKSGGVQRLMEDRLNRRILQTDITVKSMPQLKTFNSLRLMGTYEVDADGVRPQAELLLVENGMLRTLMNDRTPTRKIKQHTGNRLFAYQPQGISSSVSPGVLHIETSSGIPRDSLKKKLLETARTEGLDHACIIRTLPYGRSAMLYRVNADGSEHPVRAAVPSQIGMSVLKRSLGTSAESIVMNMIVGGVPLSIICPAAMLIEEMDIEKENLQNTTKLPVVSNPLETTLIWD